MVPKVFVSSFPNYLKRGAEPRQGAASQGIFHFCSRFTKRADAQEAAGTRRSTPLANTFASPFEASGRASPSVPPAMAGTAAKHADGENGVDQEGANGKLTLAQKKRLKQKARKQAKRVER